MKIRILSLLCCVAVLMCCHTTLYAKEKSDKLKPKWVTHALPESKSGTYFFVKSMGMGATLAGAKQQAFVSMAQMLEQERGLTVNTSVQVMEKITQNQYEHNAEYPQEIEMEVIEKGHQLKIVCREIDQYWIYDDGKYEVHVLYTVADKNRYGGSYDDKITLTSKYGAAGLLSVIPSVGQFYKGSYVKGGLILGGEIIAAGGIILCENTRASYIKKMHEQPKYAVEYNSLADSWETGRNICIGVAAAIYVYNLIDALVTPGARRVKVEPSRVTFAPVPYADNNSIGIGIAMKF
jgi:hypothetical protein